MAFELQATRDFERAYRKLAKRNPEFRRAVEGKVKQILENPFRFKPMRAPLNGFRRVHVMKSFVLLYAVKEKENSVLLLRLAHHDSAYK